MSHEEALGLAQILLALLVFSLGIPALIIESSADDRIRSLLHKRGPRSAIGLLMIFTLSTVVGLVFLSGWGLDAGSVRDRYVPAREAPWLPPNDLAAERCFGSRSVVPLRKVVPTTARIVATAQWVAKGLTVALIVLVGFFWWSMITKWGRANVVEQITNSLLRWNYKREEFEEDVDDLIVLGMTGGPGDEKKLVIAAIRNVCVTVLKSRVTYDSAKFSALIRGLARTVSNPERAGSDENHREAVRALMKCLAVAEPGVRATTSFINTLKETAALIGESAVARCAEKTVQLCIHDLVFHIAIPFRIGMAALDHERYPIAVAALSELGKFVKPGNPPPKELVALLAGFAVHGPNATDRAMNMVRNYGFTLADYRHAATEAAKEFAGAADFVVADLLTSYAASTH